MSRNVAITFSYKVEDLNLLLEVLKLNYNDPPKTFVFCNANDETFKKIEHLIDRSLIDWFFHIPDPQCYPGNTSRDTKRRQPLDMFRKVLLVMRDTREPFCYLEGDAYPLSESHFQDPFERLGTDDVIANVIDLAKININDYTRLDHIETLKSAIPQAHKMPDGYVNPLGMYFSLSAADEVSDVISQYYAELLDGKRNFEGMLGTAFARGNVPHTNHSKMFVYTYPTHNQICPGSYILHQHNIMNLKDVFKIFGIEKGKWVQHVLNETAYTRTIDGAKIERDGTVMELCSLEIK